MNTTLSERVTTHLGAAILFSFHSAARQRLRFFRRTGLTGRPTAAAAAGGLCKQRQLSMRARERKRERALYSGKTGAPKHTPFRSSQTFEGVRIEEHKKCFMKAKKMKPSTHNKVRAAAVCTVEREL